MTIVTRTAALTIDRESRRDNALSALERVNGRSPDTPCLLELNNSILSLPPSNGLRLAIANGALRQAPISLPIRYATRKLRPIHYWCVNKQRTFTSPWPFPHSLTSMICNCCPSINPRGKPVDPLTFFEDALSPRSRGLPGYPCTAERDKQPFKLSFVIAALNQPARIAHDGKETFAEGRL